MVKEFLGKAESVGSAESETLAGLRARLREERDALDDLLVSTGGGAERLATVLRRTQYRDGGMHKRRQYSGGGRVSQFLPKGREVA